MENRIWEIIAASIHGEELSPEDVSILHNWLDENKQNRDEYAGLQTFYEGNKGSLKDSINIQRAWEENCGRVKNHKMIKLRRQIVRWGYAAVVALTLGMGVLLLIEKEDEQIAKVEVVESPIVPGSPKAVLTLASGEQLDLQEEGHFVSKDSSKIRNIGNVLEYEAGVKKNNNELEYNILTIPRGGEYQLKLEDGSNVWLNAETELRFPVAFGGDERRIFLKGEAYFEVAKDAGRPFIVCADGADVTALGTEFNISTIQESGEVFTTLVNGTVRVVNEEGENCILRPEEQAVCKKGESDIGVQKVNTALYTSWKDGYYAFDKQSLGEVMRTLERWYDIHVVFVDDAEKLRFSGRVKRYEDITNLLTMIKLTNDVDFTIENRTIIVGVNKNRK